MLKVKKISKPKKAKEFPWAETESSDIRKRIKRIEDQNAKILDILRKSGNFG